MQKEKDKMIVRPHSCLDMRGPYNPPSFWKRLIRALFPKQQVSVNLKRKNWNPKDNL